MVAKRQKKFESGEGSQYMSRNAALKKLQLPLKTFRKLCIIKGIYPREPKHRRRAQKGAPGIKTLYFKKDIQFLLHEPIIWKLRDYSIFHKRMGRARAIKDFEMMKRYVEKHPTIKLDHIVKERYPTFIDAIRDLDDCLTLCFLFATFPALKHIPRDQMMLCRRLTVEFLHAVIEAKALRKVFISIKGYYYQAEIKGETVTWIIPHHFSFEPQAKAEVDFKIMSTFVEFYVIMLGFVNFRLYNSLNMFYPPTFSASRNPSVEEKTLVDEDVYVAERVSALNVNLSKTSHEVEEEVDLDVFGGEDNPEKIEEARKEAESLKRLKTLFKGLKFFLNREVPREPLVFVIRCFGGEVSWDKLSFVGSTFDESDETITHQIVDRPSMEKQFISRYYLQPQWVFDCVNARQLLPVNKYFMGEVLPPHLSPFVDKDRDQSYIPPEEKALYDPELLEKMHKDDEEFDDKIADEEDQQDEEVEDEMEDEEDQQLSDVDLDESKPKLAVTPGQVYKEDPIEKKRISNQEYRLKEKMIKGKHRNLYKSMMKGRQGRLKEAWLLNKKRRNLEENEKQEKKKNKAATSSSSNSGATESAVKKNESYIRRQKDKVKFQQGK